MSRINRVPAGLQSLLDSQNFGDNPSELSQVTAPTLELDKFLTKTLVRGTSDAGLQSNIGDLRGVTVPEGELWELLNISARFVNTNAAGARAATRIELGLIDEESGAGIVLVPLGFTPLPTVAAAASTAVGYGGTYTPPFAQLFGPGNQFLSRISDLDLNGGTSVLHAIDVLYRKYSI